MADGIVGDTYLERFRTTEAGETFTVSNATDPSGTTWAGPTITHVANGAYTLSFTPNQEGVYEATITGDTSGKQFIGKWDMRPMDASRNTKSAIDKALTILNVR